MKKRLLFILGIVFLLAAGVFGAMKFYDVFRDEEFFAATRSDKSETSETTDVQDEDTKEGEPFDKAEYSTSEPASPWWVVNKTRPLPAGYEAVDLGVPDVRLRLGASSEQMQYSGQATPDLKEMFAAAKEMGVTLVFGSGYRSEALQRQFYNGYVASDGQAAADRLSARPGTSEHQTGLAFDATSASQQCHLETCFESTAEGTWLREHAYKYGFIIRYVKGKEAITGYDYEPWHMRWVGKELSQEMHRTGIQTLEEFFGLPAAPDYL